MNDIPYTATFGEVEGLLPRDLLPDAGLPLPEQVLVDIATPLMSGVEDGVRLEELADGSILLHMEGDEDELDEIPPEAMKHDANLALYLRDTDLSTIAAQVDEWVTADEAARVDWFNRLADGLQLMGVVPSKDFTGVLRIADKVSHPLIAEAVTQFQARAISELVPSTGPAKPKVLGATSKEREEQGERVADFINYQLMVEDPDWFPETDQMLGILSRSGSQFKKVGINPLNGKVESRWIRGQYLLVPYGATSLEQAPRFTHLVPISQNDMRKYQASGFYREVELGRPSADSKPTNNLETRTDEAQGQVNTQSMLLDDADHVAMECYCNLDLPGFEDVDEEGEPTGIHLPYIVTVDRDSKQVLGIRRNWEEEDPLRNKEVPIVHYPYLPGDGFYSYGLIHMIGGLGAAGSVLLKIIIIGAAFSSFQGGYKSADARLGSDDELEFGVYKDVDLTAAELDKAFFTPDFKGPSEAIFKILGAIEDGGRRFASTADSMVGDATNTGPVGTTVALIEQGSKVFSAIHKRLHIAQGRELQLIAKLNGKNIPEGGYPFDVEGASRTVYAEDFDSRIDVVPVSDPNIFSSTQRISIAQAVIARSDANPGMYKRRRAELNFLKAMRTPDAEALLLDPSKMLRRDPISENGMLMVSRSIKAFQDQLHDAHIAVHMDLVHRLEAEKHPLAQQVIPMILAHVGEHTAYKMRMDYINAMGVQLPPMNLQADDEEEESELPAQVENQIAQMAAAAIARLPQPQGGGEQAQQQMQAMEEKAKQLTEQEERIKKMTNVAEKKQMQAAHAAQVLSLREEVAAVKRQLQGREAQDQTRQIMDAAVARVEKALAQRDAA